VSKIQIATTIERANQKQIIEKLIKFVKVQKKKPIGEMKSC